MEKIINHDVFSVIDRLCILRKSLEQGSLTDPKIQLGIREKISDIKLFIKWSLDQPEVGCSGDLSTGFIPYNCLSLQADVSYISSILAITVQDLQRSESSKFNCKITEDDSIRVLGMLQKIENFIAQFVQPLRL